MLIQRNPDYIGSFYNIYLIERSNNLLKNNTGEYKAGFRPYGSCPEQILNLMLSNWKIQPMTKIWSCWFLRKLLTLSIVLNCLLKFENKKVIGKWQEHNWSLKSTYQSNSIDPTLKLHRPYSPILLLVSVNKKLKLSFILQSTSAEYIIWPTVRIFYLCKNT